MCTRLRENGYWADFMNPFSGKPFYSYASGKNLYKIDERFRGLGIKFENKQDCLIISVDTETAFSGSVFTNAPTSLTMLQALVVDWLSLFFLMLFGKMRRMRRIATMNLETSWCMTSGDNTQFTCLAADNKTQQVCEAGDFRLFVFNAVCEYIYWI